ncbi:hypothetical protein GCM10023231_29230 [Olivibacter ginsenosidimutans]|uniref:DUF1772 domain-containing protein n=2 Tax=Olivibacter ginsenosidimutans TaxID=1176537 RepID=A0ABP9BTY0_9SPHI
MQFIIVLAYFIIAAQGMCYHLALGNALRQIPLDHFLTLRQTIDRYLRKPLKALYLGTPFLILLWIVVNFHQHSCLTASCYSIALLCLFADLWLIVKRSEPINQLINQLLHFQQVEGGHNLQEVWIKTMLQRGLFNIIGFIAILISLLLD